MYHRIFYAFRGTPAVMGTVRTADFVSVGNK